MGVDLDTFIEWKSGLFWQGGGTCEDNIFQTYFIFHVHVIVPCDILMLFLGGLGDGSVCTITSMKAHTWVPNTFVESHMSCHISVTLELGMGGVDPSRS